MFDCPLGCLVRENRAPDSETLSRLLVDFITTLVRARSKAPALSVAIEPTTPLFSTGLIDSLGILELLAFVEETTGRPIPIGSVDLRHFGTVERICRKFSRDGASR